MIDVYVEGRPAPKGSRIAVNGKDGRSWTRPASKYEEAWIKAVKAATQVAMRHEHDPGPPYAVNIEIRVARPKRKIDRKRWWPSQHDLDKLARATIDGLVKGGAMVDDRHVIALTTSKRYCATDETPGALTHVEQVPQMQELPAAA
jgi:Holliday junction resolvase RusA-like endonuclease